MFPSDGCNDAGPLKRGCGSATHSPLEREDITIMKTKLYSVGLPFTDGRIAIDCQSRREP
jgi:hypothetical protein